MKKSTVARIALAALAVSGGMAAFALLPMKLYLVEILEWVRSLGVWGPLFLVGAYILACVLLVPGSILTLGAGFLFGLLRGTVTVSIGSVLGATAAFFLGRTLARGWIEKRIAALPRFAAIDRAVGQQGFKVVLLLRLSPVFPFNLLNYAFGMTRVSPGSYVLASWIGMLPGTVMYVYLGTALKSLTETAATKEAGAAQTAFFIAGLVVTVLATVVITRIAKKALDETVTSDGKLSSTATGDANA
ncbi:MAG: TVP38/TMEM64 family protein [Planctomycetota bacterium]|jgi:uncharacterized membrane protein YdjX (TVP38/TMEM64 family)